MFWVSGIAVAVGTFAGSWWKKRSRSRVYIENVDPWFLYVTETGEAFMTKCEPKPAGALRFVCVSDTHTREGELLLPQGDVLVHAGDVLYRNGDSEGHSNILRFNHWAERQPFAWRLLVGGNHDQALEDAGVEGAREEFGAGHYLKDELLVVEGLKVYGSPESRPYVKGALTASRAFQVAGPPAHVAEIPDGLDILVTHGAPQGQLDLVGEARVGCPVLAQRVRGAQPRFHVFGHVHQPHPRVSKEGGTVYINACSVPGFDPHHGDLLPPIVFDAVPRHA